MKVTAAPPQQEPEGVPITRRFCAVLEVLVVFAAAHVLLKAFKQLSVLGAMERNARLNFSPGLVFGAVAILAIFATRQPFGSYGIGRPRSWRRPPSSRTVAAGIFLYLCPLLVLLSFDPQPDHAILSYVGFLSVVAFGEEMFFRGYMQSRLNRVFGRPLRTRGIYWGAGLILTSLSFGLLHGLNTFDYFHGHYRFDWEWAGLTAATGLVFGLIREATGRIWAGAVVHGLLDVWVIALLAFSRR